MGWLVTLAPLLLELLKFFFGGSSAEDKAKIAEELRVQFARIRAATNKAEETGGDTSELEDIVNKK